MSVDIQKPTSEFRQYIEWEGRWRHVYVISTHWQTRMFEPPAKMVKFKLTKSSRTTYLAPRHLFQDTKPRKPKNYNEMG